MKAMMTKMPQPVMLACALGVCLWERGYWQGCTMGRWFGVGGGGAVASAERECKG
jgi:hypothetical protein